MSINYINKWHLYHPWQLPASPDTRISLKSITTKQKVATLAALVLGLPLALVGGIAAFYLLSHYFKTRRIKQLLETVPPCAQKVQAQAERHLPAVPRKAEELKPAAPDSPPLCPKRIKVEAPLPLYTPPATHVGLTKGLQGDNNSCGICSVLYTLFATTRAFDFMLEPKTGNPVQANLRAIVEEFRKSGYVPSTLIEPLRQQVCPADGHDFGRVDLDEPYNQLLNKLGINQEAHLLDPTPFTQMTMEKRALAHAKLDQKAFNELKDQERLDLFKSVQQASITTQELVEGQEWGLKEPSPQIGQAMLLFIPRQAGLRPYRQVIAQPEITVKSREGPVKMRLASVISMGDYDPADQVKASEGHFVSFSFDEKGTGYAFDSMADRENEQNIPEVRHLDQFLPKLQQLQPDDKKGQDRDVRRVFFNLRACLYVRASGE